MTESERIKELEAKLAAVQSAEIGGKDPELLAKAKQRAQMSWYDVQFVLEYLVEEEHLDLETVAADLPKIRELLIDRKYTSLTGANKSAMSWQ